MNALAIITIALSVGATYLIPLAPPPGTAAPAGYLLVDTGYQRDYPAFLKGLEKKGVGLSEIKAVFVTHAHDDHAGFLNELKRDSGCRVIMSRSTAALLPTGKNDTESGGFWANRRVAFLAGLKARLDGGWTLSYPSYLAADDDLVFEEGGGAEALRSVGLEARTIATPGHCGDHQALLLADGTCFAGDAAAAMLLWAGTRHLTIFNTEIPQVYRDWEAMLAAGATRILPAHGKPYGAEVLRREAARAKPGRAVPFEGLR